MSKLARSVAVAATFVAPNLASAEVVNGSFEANAYQGWTLEKDAAAPSFATAALVSSGKTVVPGSTVYDHIDNIGVANYSDGLPLEVQPTEGNWQAVLLQNGPSRMRLSQIVTLPAAPQLSFDLAYHNWDDSFSAAQTFQVQLRDVDSNALLATEFETVGDANAPMIHHTVGLDAFAAKTVRLQFELVAENSFFDVQLDNVVVLSTEKQSDGQLDLQLTADQAGAADVIDGGGCTTTRSSSSLLIACALLALRRRRRR